MEVRDGTVECVLDLFYWQVAQLEHTGEQRQQLAIRSQNLEVTN